MRDRNLENHIHRLEALIDNWKQFSQYLDRGFQQQNIAPEDESAFLELKSQIVREFETLMTLLAVGTDRDERPLRLVNVVTSLQAIRDLPEGTAGRIATDWHHTFMGWQALLGRLRGRQAQMAAMNSFAIGFRRVFGHPLTATLLITAAAYGVYKLTDEWVPKLTFLFENVEKTK
jgi:hypothetical protein